jgi:predicted amino acid-binding ACT domain protein
MIAGLNANLGLDLDGQIADNILNHSGNRMSGHVADLLRALGSPVTPDSYWPYEGYKFGRFAISGADTGTYTRIQDVADATQIKSGDYLYGACLLKAVAETSVTSCAITVTGLDEDGNVATFTGTLAGVAGTEVNLVNAAPTLKAFYVTSIAIVGGAAAESFLIQVKPDRVVAF